MTDPNDTNPAPTLDDRVQALPDQVRILAAYTHAVADPQARGALEAMTQIVRTLLDLSLEAHRGR